MTLTVNATAGSATANSYITRAELDAYLDLCLHLSAAVTAATDTDKDKAICWATRLLDEQVEWSGEPTEPDVQVLQWPRAELEDELGEDLSGTIIPVRLKNATAELARYLLESDRTAESSTDGIDALAVGSIKIDFSSNAPPPRKVIPDAVWQMVSIWGKRKHANSPVQDMLRG